MKILVNWGFEQYIDEIIEAPNHVAAVDVPEDLVKQWNEASEKLAALEKEIQDLIREQRAAV